ncbi:MAG: methylmalonyl-CoA decarboxylase [Betaproteobacteria bacterium]
MALVLTEKRNSTGVIILNSYENRNALSTELVSELMDALNGFRALNIRAVVLRAQPGVKVWSAGHDITELPNRGRDPLGWYDQLRVLIRTIQEFPAPVIALIEGSVWGGGCEVAMACDMLVTTPNATFAITPAKLGVPYNLGGLLTLVNMIPLPLAKEMLFTAQPLPAEQAWNLGITNYIKSTEEIEEFVFTMAAQIGANSPLSVSVMKEELRLLSSASAMSPEVFERIQGLRRVVYDSEDYQEGIDAFREKRKPVFHGK